MTQWDEFYSHIKVKTVSTMKLPPAERILANPAFVINLERNKNRYYYTKKLLQDAGFKNPVPFAAIDGVASRDSEDEYDQRYRAVFGSFNLPGPRGGVGGGGQGGCSLSHLTLWSWCAIGKYAGMMIFEDDALPRPDFKEIFPRYWNAIDQDVDMVFLGNSLSKEDVDSIPDGQLIEYRSSMCTHAFFLTKQGARKLLHLWGERNHLRAGADIGEPKGGGIFCIIDGFISEMINKGNISAACMIGKAIPMKGEYNGFPWYGRSTGIVQQNADLASDIHGFQAAPMKYKDDHGHDIDEFHKPIDLDAALGISKEEDSEGS